MKKYKLNFGVTIQVEAKNKEDAIRQAEDIIDDVIHQEDMELLEIKETK